LIFNNELSRDFESCGFCLRISSTKLTAALTV
jgi:hypothetical protein